ncbi:diadenylate cyclase CdaA [Atopobacter phocae]|uniref:diadenylate cyclase CdaA n=1 Tax=Atopobacter phocae TaxID=136492 RepID=UPI000A03909B|nr:diadenylate cyclase CdaA [Atopobacter phocae]
MLLMFEWTNFLSWQTLIQCIDIAVVWFLIYKLLQIIRGTRAVHLVQGLIVVLAIKVFAYMIGLNTLDYIINMIIQWGIIGLIVVFQPEIRRGLEHIGRSTFWTRQIHRNNPSKQLISEIIKATAYMAKRRIGALISIEIENSLQEYVNTGIPLDADISNQLLINIFIPNTPLHDGAVIIQGYKISTAASYLPLSESPLIPKELGTRHRAAIGLSEVSDALTIIVSEETGAVSITHHNRLFRDLNEERLESILEDVLVHEDEKKDSSMKSIRELFEYFKAGGDKNE